MHKEKEKLMTIFREKSIHSSAAVNLRCFNIEGYKFLFHFKRKSIDPKNTHTHIGSQCK